MANVIPDDILENLICSRCTKYLSVKPIKIYHNRQIRCGRCVEEGDGGVESLYGVFAEEILFPCINRYEDCNQLLRYSEVKNHEVNCCVRSYQCMNCNEFVGSAYELFTHCKVFHKENVIYSGEFPININSESMGQCYLYRQGNFLFIVNVNCDKSCEELRINMTFIGPVSKGKYLKYQLVFYNFKRDITYTGRVQSCLPWDTSTYYQVTKFSDLCSEEKMFICKINLNASECEGLIVPSQSGQIKNKSKLGKLKGDKIPSDNLTTNPVYSFTETNVEKEFRKDNFTPSNFNENLVCCVTRPAHMNILGFNTELNVWDILDSPFRPSIKRKFTLDPALIHILPKKNYNQVSLSDDQTSVVFTNEDSNIEFEMICYGCKQNLPAFSFMSDNKSLNVVRTVYGCACPNNLVCENCFNVWKFNTCRKRHEYIVKIVESTVLSTLLYRSLKDGSPLLYICDDFKSHVDIGKLYCYCHGGPLFYSLKYLDLIKTLLTLNLSVFNLAWLCYHGIHCRYMVKVNIKQFSWLMPFVSHRINLVDLLDQTFITVVDTIIIVEKFPNYVSTVFKVKFNDVSQNRDIAAILNFGYHKYQIFKGDFVILNTDISIDTLISFRII